MKIFLYADVNLVSEYFQEEDYNIPFLGSTLFDFVVNSYRRFWELSGSTSEFKVFTPKIWNVGDFGYDNIHSELSEENEIVFITTLFHVPFFDFTKDDYQFLIQHPDKLFSHSTGMKFGFISKKTNIDKLYTEELQGFNNIVFVNHQNFLKVNQSLLNNFSGTKPAPGSYGLPFNLASSENIVRSKICAPCFIGEDVKIMNSVIYPGTVLTGNTVIENSEIFESFICEASVKNSVTKNSLVAVSSLDHIELEDSIIPRGSILFNGRKR